MYPLRPALMQYRNTPSKTSILHQQKCNDFLQFFKGFEYNDNCDWSRQIGDSNCEFGFVLLISVDDVVLLLCVCIRDV